MISTIMRALLRVGARADGQVAFAVCFQHRLFGICQDIQKYLLQLMGICNRLGQVPVQFAGDFDVVDLKLIASQFDRFFQNIVDVGKRSFGLLLAGKGEQILNDLLAAQRQIVDLEKVVLRAVIEVLAQLQQVGNIP